MDFTLSALRTISFGSVVSLFTISRFRIGTVGLKICNSSYKVNDQNYRFFILLLYEISWITGVT